MDHSQPSRRPYWQFSLRGLLVITMLVAAYTAGWISHREWNRRHLIQSISEALEAVNAPIALETVEGTDIFTTRGRKEDVDAVMSVIEAAKQ